MRDDGERLGWRECGGPLSSTSHLEVPVTKGQKIPSLLLYSFDQSQYKNQDQHHKKMKLDQIFFIGD